MGGGTNYGLMFMLVAFFAFSGILMIGFIIYIDKQKPTAAKQARMFMSQGATVKYLKRFERYDNFFLTRGGIRKVHSRLCELSVYTAIESKVIAVKYYTASLRTMSLLIIAGAYIFKDLFTTLLVVLFAIVIKTMMVDKQIDKIHYKLLKQLLISMGSIRQTYLMYDNIPDAISEANILPYLERPFQEIYLVLTSTDKEKRLEELYESTPFRQIQTFASVAFLINDTGDTKHKDGSSSFIQALDMLEAEIRLEVRKLTLMKTKFGILEILPILPLFTIKGIEVFFANIIPGTTVLYNGPLGYTCKILILLLALIGYITIVKINSVIPVKRDDRTGVATSILDYNWYKGFIKSLIPKKVKKVAKKQKKIKGALSLHDLETLYARKVVYALMFFAVALALQYFSVNLGKEFIWRNTAEASLVAGKPLSADELAVRKEMDLVYLSTKPAMNQQETLNFVESRLPKLQEYDKQAQVQRLMTKYKDYYNTYFKWWMVVVAYLAALLGWFSPEIGLSFRSWILKTEAEEDVLQLQTLIAILMTTSVDTLDTLYWMQKNSRVHSRHLKYAYQEYPGEPRLALERLKAQVTLPEFHRVIDKLMLTIHQITLSEAFADQISERDHLIRMREIAQISTIEKKRRLASPLALAPLYAVAFLYILLPMGILGVKEFVSAMQNLS